MLQFVDMSKLQLIRCMKITVVTKFAMEKLMADKLSETAKISDNTSIRALDSMS